MSDSPPVTILIDDRIRLLAAALAGTDYPQQAQARKRHYVPSHARATRKSLWDNRHSTHPAVQGLQALLNANVPLEALYTLALTWGWPGLKATVLPKWVPQGWNQQMWAFYEAADLKSYWYNQRVAWDNARGQAQRVFAEVHFRDFLRPFIGDIPEDLAFMPNISYPADHEVGVRAGQQLLVITPPPLAWGDSPPWPYDEETMITHSLRAALTQYGRLLLKRYLRAHKAQVDEAKQKELPISDAMRLAYSTWEQQFIALFIAAAVAIYLEDYVSPYEAKAYMLMEKKTRGMTLLPGTVSVLRRYLQERGQRYNTLAEFLSVFPTQLRVAKRIVTL